MSDLPYNELASVASLDSAQASNSSAQNPPSNLKIRADGEGVDFTYTDSSGQQITTTLTAASLKRAKGATLVALYSYTENKKKELKAQEEEAKKKNSQEELSYAEQALRLVGDFGKKIDDKLLEPFINYTFGNVSQDLIRAVEQESAKAHYDNSKTDIQIAWKPEAFGDEVNNSIEKFLKENDPEIKDLLQNEERKNLTKEELEREKQKLLTKAETNPGLREAICKRIMADSTEIAVTKQPKAIRIPSVGPLETEYFGPDKKDSKLFSLPNQVKAAQKHGFAPTNPSGANMGVAIQNRVKDNMLLIRNLNNPPESLNCTIRVPRVNENGSKLNSYDTIVIRNGEPVMISQGEVGKSRIANLADMMENLNKNRSQMRGATKELPKSQMQGVAGHESPGQNPFSSQQLTRTEAQPNTNNGLPDQKALSNMQGATRGANPADQNRSISNPPSSQAGQAFNNPTTQPADLQAAQPHPSSGMQGGISPKAQHYVEELTKKSQLNVNSSKLFSPSPTPKVSLPGKGTTRNI